MLRQVLQALRFAIADFFDVPWQSVVAMLAAVLLLGLCAYVRTIYGASSHHVLQAMLLMGGLIGVSAAGNYFKRR